MNKRVRQNKLSEYEKLVKRIYNSKKGLKKISFDKFFSWYKNQNDSCAYCGFTTNESLKLFKMFPASTRGGRRGKRLEIDRIKPGIDYGNDINNLVLACYWCNNAKSNYFTFDEFLKIGSVFKEIQKQRMNKSI